MCERASKRERGVRERKPKKGKAERDRGDPRAGHIRSGQCGPPASRHTLLVNRHKYVVRESGVVV